MPPAGLCRLYVPLLSSSLAAIVFLILLAWGLILCRKGLQRSSLSLLLIPLVALSVGAFRQADFVRPRSLDELAFQTYDDTVQIKYFTLSIHRDSHTVGYAGSGKRLSPEEAAAWEDVKSLEITPLIPLALRKQLPTDINDWTYVLAPSFRSQVDRSTTPSLDIHWYSDHLLRLEFSAFGGKDPVESIYYYIPAGLSAGQIEALASTLLRTT